MTDASKPELNGSTKISLAILVAIVLQGSAVIWWASSLNQRVAVLEAWKGQQDQVLERVTRVEERITSLKEQGNRIEDAIKDLDKKDKDHDPK